MRRAAPTGLVVVVLIGCLALSAQAAPRASGAANATPTQIAPPGNSGVQQYFEAVPGAGGGQTPGSRGGHSPLSAATRRALSARGAAGLATANLAAETAPPSATAGQLRTSTAPRDRSRGGPQAGGQSQAGGKSQAGGQSQAGGKSRAGPLSATLSAATARASVGAGSNGISPLLAVLLGAMALAALAILLVRRRSSAPPPAA